MNVRTKLRGAFAVYIALLASLSIYHIGATRHAVRSSREFAAIALRLRTTTAVQLGRIAQASSDVEKYLVTRDTGYLNKIRQTMVEYDADLRDLDSQPLSSSERALMSPLSAEWAGVMQLASELERVAKDSVATALARVRMLESLDRVHDGMQALGVASQEAMRKELTDFERSEQKAERVTMIAAGGAVLLTLLLSALLARSFLEPLVRLTEGTREVSAGRFGHRLSTKGNDELAQVAREFNAMTERLDELDRMKREFVSKVSHDLKTPLSSMQETNGVMLDEVAGPLTPKQRQLLVINQDSAQRLSAMLSKLLDLSRIEAGVDAEQQIVDVRPLVRHSVDRLTEGSSASRVSVTMSDSATRLLVRGDANDLTQVFDNLLENALKFSPFDGKVRVRVVDLTSRGDVPPERWTSLRRRGPLSGAVLVTVSDEGSGIADEDKERVFARFYQTDAGRAVRGRGVGLGLAISREIVTNHGGEMWVTDNQPRGSVFFVLLPGAARVDNDSSSPALAADGAHRA